MKRVSLIMLCVILLGACVTNPYTEDDYVRMNRRPPSPTWTAYITGLVPGWTQFRHAEILESVIYMGGFICGAGILGSADIEDTELYLDKPGEYIGLGLMGASVIVSYIDGVITASKRNRQYVDVKPRGEALLAERQRELDEKEAQKTLYLGMSRYELIDRWGRPTDINTSVGSWGTHEQFIYPGGLYVYLQNGKVTSWQY